VSNRSAAGHWQQLPAEGTFNTIAFRAKLLCTGAASLAV